MNTDDKKTTLVVGADSDIGAAVIGRLSGNIVAHYYAFPEKVDSLGGVTPVKGDLSTAEGIQRFVDDVKALDVQIDKILHLPSVPAKSDRIKNLDPEMFLRELNISLISAAIICREFVPDMAKRKFGRLVFMLTSYIIGVPPKFLATYVTCKYALEGFMKSLAVEFADKGVTVNGVAPYMMNTKFLENVADITIEQSAKANPTGRNATVDDVVPAVLMLIDDKNEYTTGAVIPITGGSAF